MDMLARRHLIHLKQYGENEDTGAGLNPYPHSIMSNSANYKGCLKKRVHPKSDSTANRNNLGTICQNHL